MNINVTLWWRVGLGFTVGTIAGSAFLLVYLSWRKSNDHPPVFYPAAANLAGHWEGQESFGTTFVVNRQADGNFTGQWDFRRSATPHQPPVVDAAGRFAVSGSSYAYYFTRSSDPAWLDRPPLVRTLRDCTPQELNYDLEAGNGSRELKK